MRGMFGRVLREGTSGCLGESMGAMQQGRGGAVGSESGRVVEGELVVEMEEGAYGRSCRKLNGVMLESKEGAIRDGEARARTASWEYSFGGISVGGVGFRFLVSLELESGRERMRRACGESRESRNRTSNSKPDSGDAKILRSYGVER